jgi:hypothetical protein
VLHWQDSYGINTWQLRVGKFINYFNKDARTHKTVARILQFLLVLPVTASYNTTIVIL